MELNLSVDISVIAIAFSSAPLYLPILILIFTKLPSSIALTKPWQFIAKSYIGVIAIYAMYFFFVLGLGESRFICNDGCDLLASAYHFLSKHDISMSVVTSIVFLAYLTWLNVSFRPSAIHGESIE